MKRIVKKKKALIIHLSKTACMAIIFCVKIQDSADKPTRRENPHKYLLYKPTFSQLYTFLASSFKVYLTQYFYCMGKVRSKWNLRVTLLFEYLSQEFKQSMKLKLPLQYPNHSYFQDGNCL